MPSSAKNSRLGGALNLLLLSIVFHSVYLGSIFDIYFVSRVVQVGSRYGVGPGLEQGCPGGVVGEGLAKRVVLIVGDGLRADKIFQKYPNPPFPNSEPLPFPIPFKPHYAISANETTPAPYLRSLIQSGKTEWGISHTRVPTESRPGHVALIGGMYEDVAAVTRGWKSNPVTFDSVFNQSSHTFSFGSPDILPMFKDGASDPSRVDAWSYGHEFEDFTTDAVHLDLWVLERLKMLFHNATLLASQNQQLNAPGTVFFLHLLGLDTTGHSYRPHGPEYHRNIRVVDYVVEETVKAFNTFYSDDDTAFIFTADHGMSNKGNHGDGELDNTRTPLIAWGAGLRGRLQTEGILDSYSAPWGLAGSRKDVEQADVAVLMSILAGVPIPSNSVGRVPLDYLDASSSFKARASIANAHQILAEFSVRSSFKQKHSVSFRPFPGLTDNLDEGTSSIETHNIKIKSLMDQEKYDEAQVYGMELTRVGLNGLRYFQTYDWRILKSIVTIGYAGFIAYSVKFTLEEYVLPDSVRASPPPLSFSVMLSALMTFLAISAKFFHEKAPISYYLYAIFPCYLWGSTLGDTRAIKHVLGQLKPSSISSLSVKLLFGLCALESMVIGYMRRWVFSLLLIAMAAIWPLVGMSSSFRDQNIGLVWSWCSSCLALAVFPMLPVEKGENMFIIAVGSGVCLIAALIRNMGMARKAKLLPPDAKRRQTSVATVSTVSFQIALIAFTTLVTWASASSLQAKRGLPLWSQISGWIILLASSLTPIIHGRPKEQLFLDRLLVLQLAFVPVFILLSLSYETLFYAIFSLTLCLWAIIESKITKEAGPTASTVTLSGQHIRIALFFLAFFHIAFFGVGNVASISSFYLEPVYRLIPVFAPFPMAILLLYKLLIPFVLLSAVTSSINQHLHLPSFSLFIIASILSEVLVINFFFLVTDQGSWLEIGSTITNFAICSLLSIFNTALFFLGETAMRHTSLEYD